MITDANAVRLAAAIYDPNSVWDRRWVGVEPDGIFAALKDNVLVFRGSVTVEDWLRDLRGLPIQHPLLGGVEKGFMEGLDEFYAEIVDSLGEDPVIVGHSLGAARALLFAGLLVANKRPVSKVVTFGSPRPGCKSLSVLLEDTPIFSYKNRFDPVTNAPVPILPDMPYMHPRPLIKINIPPALDAIGIFADHNINLYVKGVAG